MLPSHPPDFDLYHFTLQHGSASDMGAAMIRKYFN